jgi:hypothetical protein
MIVLLERKCGEHLQYGKSCATVTAKLELLEIYDLADSLSLLEDSRVRSPGVD